MDDLKQEVNLKKTILYEEHVKNGAKIVEFGGFLMPIEYKGITEEHLAVRKKVGLFDVSHMGEILVTGKDTNKYLDYLLTSSITKAKDYRMAYGLLLYPDGGIVDDLMVYKYNDEKSLIVCNASNTDKDFEWLKQNIKNFEVEVVNKSSVYGQLALQGKDSIEILQKYTLENLNELTLFTFKEIVVNNSLMIVSRSGYTGEDGFEIYGDNNSIIDLFNKFVYEDKVELCGLGCRDTLRFEAAMPLYGHEINYNINPIEACLNYAICYDKDFIGKEALLKYKVNPTRKLVGLELLERGIARGGYEIVNDNETVGYVTTGYMIPGTNKALALGYVPINLSEIGTVLNVRIRKNLVKVIVRDRKFMNKKYVK